MQSNGNTRRNILIPVTRFGVKNEELPGCRFIASGLPLKVGPLPLLFIMPSLLF
jgi:hypothetical protein